MSKHRDRQFFIARSVFGLAAAFLVGLVVWIAVRAGGPAEADDTPVIVQPSADLRAAESTTAPLLSAPPSAATPARHASPSASVSPSVSPSASASPSASPSKSSASPSPSKSPKPSPSKTTVSPPAPQDLSATYSTVSSWDRAFVASVQITNRGSQAHDLSLTLTYPAGVSLGGTWNARGSSSGSTITLGGVSVPPGRTITVGFQSSKTTTSKITPTGCTVVGGSCSVS
ncbi:cellulose binding domain-containing protein [Actinoplanes oblitus]|uniref:Cellulose binding domain-containing protein n=1 Tax=Actinoplanes oblitus TaxID=3040509 RepID=A0ABY8WJW4_9ACTN|nr:cellulose binding domain-containing protein [Actinoplanes oblitus]WIM97398.1 cellulose binding domain-containing protein [Actinoplanes oblitus]